MRADAPILPRPPDLVMRLERMGAAHPTRLSFLRQLLRRARTGRWRFDRPLWQVDARGVGRAVYRVRTGERTYSLIAFAHDLPAEARSDRVIAMAWDATFALFDGDPAAADLDRLAASVPVQEAGRLDPTELCLSRANRSGRLFEHVVERLARGRQPDADMLRTGYLMRTTAVYGSGKFGAADRAGYAARGEMAAPFQAEMLTVWLIRRFTIDIAEHLARARGGTRAARLDPAAARALGVGNSTGLGMAPFLVRHPALIHAWVSAREEALARVRALPDADSGTRGGFRAALEEARRNAALWQSEHPVQVPRLAALRADLGRIAGHRFPAGRRPWDALWRWGEGALGPEGQEALLALMLEPNGAWVDDLGAAMACDEGACFAVDGAMPLARLRGILDARYDWASGDGAAPTGARFWYVSEEKLEPRIGLRDAEDGAALEQPLDVARQAAALRRALRGRPGAQPVAVLLRERPDLRGIVRRAQIAEARPYAEVRDDLCDPAALPIDLMRCKLAFFGASRFDPRSDRWVRISLFQDRPCPSELDA